MSKEAVELELLFKDSVTEGMKKAGKSSEELGSTINRVSASITERINEQEVVVKQVENDLKRLKVEYAKTPAGSAQKQMRDEIKACKVCLDEERGALKSLQLELKKGDHAVSSASGKFDTLGTSVQQIVREVPSLSMGINTFFLAISNNIGPLQDALKRANAEFKQMKANGETATPVWKQLAGSLLSMNTAVTVGIMLLSMYSKDIVEWGKKLFRSNAAVSEHNRLQREMTSTLKEASAAAAVERSKMDLLYKATQDASVPLRDRKQAVRDLQQQYPAYFGNLSQEAVLAGKAASAYRQLSADLLKAAMARAYEKRVEKMAERNATLEIYKNANDNYFKRTRSQYAAALQKDAAQREYTSGVSGGVTAGFAESGMVQRGGSEMKDPIIEERKQRIKTQRGIIKELEANKKLMEDLQAKALSYQPELNKVDSNGYGGTARKERKQKADAGIKDMESLAEMEQAARKKIEENKAALMADEYERERAEAKLNFEKEQDRIKEEEERRIELVRKLRKAGKVVTPAQEKEITASASEQRAQAAQLYAQEVDEINRKEIEAGVKKGNKEKEELDKLLGKYQTFAAKRLEIEKTFAEDTKQLNAKRTANNASEIDTALVEAAKVRDKAIRDVNNREAEEMKNSNSLLVSLFEDTSDKSIKEIDRIIERVRLLLQYMNAEKTADGTALIKDRKGKVVKRITERDIAGMGMTAEQVERLRQSPESLKAIIEQYDKLREKVVQKNPFKALVANIRELFDSKSTGDGTEKKLERLGASAATVADEIGQIAGRLSAVFEAAGNDGMAQAMADVQMVMGSVSNIAKGFAQGGIAGGVMATIGEAVNMFGKAAAASARHKAALHEIMKDAIAQQRAYNLLLMQQNLAYERGTTIFGSDAYGKAANAIGVMEQAMRDLSKAQEELGKVDIVTGHKKTGLFGWGKGKDTYTSILEAIPDVIDENGKLKVSVAEVALSTRKMSDESKAALQNMIELSKQQEAAWTQVTDYMKGIFGNLGDSISDSLRDAFENGTDAGKTYVDKMKSMLENLGQQMIESVTIAPLLQQAQEEILKITKNNSLNADEKFDNYSSVIDGLIGQVSSKEGDYMRLMKLYQEAAARHGLEIYQADASKQTVQTGRAGSYETMTHDQGTKLEGLFTSAQIHLASMDIEMEDVSGKMGQVLDRLARIESHVSHCDKLDDIADVMYDIKRNGVKVK